MIKARYIVLKFVVAASAFFGVLSALVHAQADGYTHWGKRLLYFTAQSNIWLGVTYVFLGVFSLLKRQRDGAGMRRMYFLRYIFLVSITMTCLVFCLLLAPFADENYHPWTLPNVCTHVITPALALLDFFVDRPSFTFGKRDVLFTLLPPLVYFGVTSVMTLLRVDFGRGVCYPYFFMNYFSEAGLLGFSSAFPFVIGSLYWYVLLAAVLLAIAWLYKHLSEKVRAGRKTR